MLTAPVELPYTTNSPGRSQDFSKGGHTESNIGYSPDCHLNIVGCFLTKRLINGGRGVTGTPGHPLATPLIHETVRQSLCWGYNLLIN